MRGLTQYQYAELYKYSIEDPDGFWAEQARQLDWIRPWLKVKNTSFENNVDIRWFEGGELNLSYNCVDRHAKKNPGAVAILWEPDNPNHNKRIISYGELQSEVVSFARVLKKCGVNKGDRVTIYLPQIPEAAFAMLACARIGAVHSVVFGGFSADALAGRIQDSQSKVVITADGGHRGGRLINLKATVDEALVHCPGVQSVFVIQNTHSEVAMKVGRDFWMHDQKAQLTQVDADVMESVGAEDPLFILYTSGSTGKPKGVLHTSGGYLVYANTTFRYVFDYQQGEVFWCTADVGWITGHTYLVYGPLSVGATILMFEGVPQYPKPSRHWEIIDHYKVNIYYTAPTAIRALMKEGDQFVKDSSRTSLRLLGTVGEPINPEAWKWYHQVIGRGRLPIVDTWWQTETGGAMIVPLPGVSELKPGSAMKPFFGVRPVIVNNEGKVLNGACEGNLCLEDSWPGQARTVFGDHEKYRQTYFSTYKGYYFTGDGCRRDVDGDYWITGRVDDVLNVAGHRLGTAEIESALVAHSSVAEAAVVGCPHEIKGQGIYAYVTLKSGISATPALKSELIQWVRKEISPIATPDHIHWAPALPKTRSGKIMRRILRKIAEGVRSGFGDTSTLADPSVVDQLLKDLGQ